MRLIGKKTYTYYWFILCSSAWLLNTVGCQTSRHWDSDQSNPHYHQGKLNPFLSLNDREPPTTPPSTVAMAAINLMVGTTLSQDYYKIARLGGSLEVSYPNTLPRHGFRYRVQLLNSQQTDILGESEADSEGKFQFHVDDHREYFLRVLDPKGRQFQRIFGPFKRGNDVQIQIQNP